MSDFWRGVRCVHNRLANGCRHCEAERTGHQIDLGSAPQHEAPEPIGEGTKSSDSKIPNNSLEAEVKRLREVIPWLATLEECIRDHLGKSTSEWSRAFRDGQIDMIQQVRDRLAGEGGSHG